MIEGEDFTHRVGDLIRKARKAQGLTQAELGQLAGGKNKETINRLEAGENTRLQTLVDIAAALGTTADAVLAAARTGQTSLRTNAVTSPVSQSDVHHGRGGAPIRTLRQETAGGLEYESSEGPPASFPRTPLPPDEELVDRMREHAELLRYTINSFRQHTKLLWNIIAIYDAGQIRSDRTPRPPTARGPRSRDRRPVSATRHPRKAGAQ